VLFYLSNFACAITLLVKPKEVARIKPVLKEREGVYIVRDHPVLVVGV
jgi:hypothetical protein